ncbi:MAG: hypothetical protein M3408_01820 [Actinomycetota bacterium]|nr:hypothetical protein [Actinomycetota bacterium]
MSRGGAAPTTALVGWVFLDRHRHDGYTVRWRRGDAVAHVLAGDQIGNLGMVDVLDTIPVSPSGWSDLAEIRTLGQRWLRGRTRRTGNSASKAPDPEAGTVSGPVGSAASAAL